MNKHYTIRNVMFICILLMSLQVVHAQYPAVLSKYPGIIDGGEIKALAQKGNIVYLGGTFANLGKDSVRYGMIYDNLSATAPRLTDAAPDQPVTISVPDGNGGWFLLGRFTKLGTADRDGLARLNADGTVHAFDAKAGLDQWASFNSAVTTPGGHLVIGTQSITSIGGSPVKNNITALDGNTGQVISGWNNLTIPGGWPWYNSYPEMMTINGNKLYAYHSGAGMISIDISNINAPVPDRNYMVEGQYYDQWGGEEGLGGYNPLFNQFAYAKGDRLYMSAAGYTEDYEESYTVAETANGQSFNSKFFLVDLATGKYIRSFALESAYRIESVVEAGDVVYVIVRDFQANHKKVRAYNINTGADLSSTLPICQRIFTFPPVGELGPLGAALIESYVTTDGKLILYRGFTEIDGVAFPSCIVAFDLSTGALTSVPQSVIGIGRQAKTSRVVEISESAGKFYYSGSIAYGHYNSVPFKGLAAINSVTGEIYPWVQTDLNIKSVNALTVSGNTLLVGGDFRHNSGLTGGRHLAAFDISNPTAPVLNTNWTASNSADTTVNALTPAFDRVFVGGRFTQIGGMARKAAAAFSVNGGNLSLSDWNPSISQTGIGFVNRFSVYGNKLYMGGQFTIPSGAASRTNAAAFDFGGSANGTLTAWDPKITAGNVNAFVFQPAAGTDHAERAFIGGGYMNRIGTNNFTIRNLGVVPTTDAAVATDPWQIATGFNSAESRELRAMAIHGNTLYVGGDTYFKTADVSGNFGQADAENLLTVIGNGRVGTLLSAGNLLIAGGLDFTTPSGETGLAFIQTGQLPGVITSLADSTKTYGDAAFELNAASSNSGVPVTYSIAVGDNADNVISLNGNTVQVLRAGEAWITASQAAGNDFLAADDLRIKITVNKASLTIALRDTTGVLNQTLPTFPYTLTGWVNGDDETSGKVTGSPEITTTATQGSPEGTYPVTIAGNGTLSSVYYDFVAGADATLTINATGSAPQLITFPAIAAKTYGDADFDLNATTDATGLSVSYSSSNASVVTISGGKVHIVGAGTAVITAAQAGDPAYAPATPVEHTFTVNKAALTITADNQTKNNGTANPVLTATYTGFVNNETAAVLLTPVVLSTTANTASAPGIYPISVSGATSNNYEISFVNGTMTVRGTQVITWAPLSVLTYGDASFNPGAVSAAGSSFTPTYTTNNPAVVAIENGQAVIKGAGSATITATFGAANGWDLTTSTQNVTVLKKQLTIKADDKSRFYGEANPLFTLNYTGFVNNDNAVNGALTTQPSVATTATAASPAGFYAITVSGAVSNNYDPVYVNGNLEVKAVVRTFTFGQLPVKTYGNAAFNPGASVNTGETITYISDNTAVAAIENGLVRIAGAGTATITATVTGNGSATGATSASQTLMVNKAPLQITADNKTKSQGTPDMLLTATYTGFVNGENHLSLSTRPVLSTTANTFSPSGTYPISVSGATSNNYAITYQNGTLTIVPGADGADHSLEAWSSSPSTLEVRLYVAESQQVSIQLYSFSGQRMITMEKQLTAGLNQQQLNVANLPAGIYVLHVTGAKLKLKQNIKVK
jgi:hypothetical protein